MHDQRQARRFQAFGLEARVWTEAGELIAPLLDLSLKGAFVMAAIPDQSRPAPGTPAMFDVLRAGACVVRLKAHVVEVISEQGAHPVGFGIAFEAPPVGSARVLADIVELLEARESGLPVPMPAPTPVPHVRPVGILDAPELSEFAAGLVVQLMAKEREVAELMRENEHLRARIAALEPARELRPA